MCKMMVLILGFELMHLSLASNAGVVGDFVISCGNCMCANPCLSVILRNVIGNILVTQSLQVWGQD